MASGLYSQAPETLPAQLADYRAYLKAVEYDGLSQYAYVLSELQPVWATSPRSPILGRAALLAARAYTELGQPADSVEILQKYQAELVQPEGLMTLAAAFEAAGNAPSAAAAYQRVYYEYPMATDAPVAESTLERLRAQLGDQFPPAMPQAMLGRAEMLMRAGEQSKAKREYEMMASLLAGRDRDIARVRARTGNEPLLASLTVDNAEADAERLYLLHAAARRAKNDNRAAETVEELGRKYPKSRWRLEALISLGNMYLLRNDTAAYEPVYRECYESFASAYCHWKVAWLKHRKGDSSLLREHIEKYPGSEKRSAALYFLRRYAEVAEEYPLSYYAVLAREKTSRAALPVRKVANVDFTPNATLRTRIERSRLLEAAGLTDWAEFELKYAARNDGQPFAAALALAEFSSARGAHDQAIRYIKSFARGYLSMPLEAAPDRFWRLAFPLPYREPLESYSRQHSLDPFVIAALVRQESEFNPKAISRARAYGLTQVLPSTGRQLSRRAGITRFTPSMLFQPDVNLRLGTLYMRSLLDKHEGKWEQTLASYNAGKSRTDQWLTWADYREPAEFIETIPFTETREYIQIVMRNADVYKRLYGSNGGTRRASR